MSRCFTKESSAQGLAKVQEGDYAFIWDSAVLEYVINQDPCNTFILNDLFSPLGYGIGLPLHSPYKDAISNEILKLRENGFLDKLKSEWFVQKGTCGVKSTTTSLVVTVQLADVIGVYLLVAGGVLLGFIALAFEWFYFTRKLAKNSDSVSDDIWAVSQTSKGRQANRLTGSGRHAGKLAYSQIGQYTDR